MSEPAGASTMVCAGCGAEATGVYPFRCPRAGGGDDVDHVLARALDMARATFPASDDPHPFVSYRTLLHSYHVARAQGMTDEGFVALVRELDGSVTRVDGGGFVHTPFGREAAISDRLGFAAGGGVWVKDETGNVSGSHKARHLAGVMLYLLVLERIGLAQPPFPPLAIASCGNAALAAAVVARAADRRLLVFIPPDAAATTVTRLRDLGATITTCERAAGIAGDPCYHAFRTAVAGGALPFCCQGNENGLTIEGGETLGYEMISQPGPGHLDRIVIQVGGGALASAVIQAFTEARALGRVAALPRFHTVQTFGAYPLKRAYDLLAPRTTDSPAGPLRYAATHRHEFMWPWEQQPHSIAHGILDDETYDWLAVVKGMLDSRGSALVVSEAELEAAYAAANSTRPPARRRLDHTGAAGLAGLMQLVARGDVAPHERIGIIYSGAERS